MKLFYHAYFSPLQNSEGFCVTFPDLPGCVTQGHSLPEALENAIDAASGWVLDELEDGNPAPKASPRENIKIAESGDFVNLIALDIDAYAEKFGTKAVRKNCTIPAWMDTAAEKKGLNFSAILKEGIEMRLGVN